MRIRGYLRDVYDEMLHKVSWPTWKELQSSALVMIASLLIALVIFLMDISFEHLMDWVYRWLY